MVVVVVLLMVLLLLVVVLVLVVKEVIRLGESGGWHTTGKEETVVKEC